MSWKQNLKTAETKLIALFTTMYAILKGQVVHNNVLFLTVARFHSSANHRTVYSKYA